jgi:hypothetical protein
MWKFEYLKFLYIFCKIQANFSNKGSETFFPVYDIDPYMTGVEKKSRF